MGEGEPTIPIPHPDATCLEIWNIPRKWMFSYVQMSTSIFIQTIQNIILHTFNLFFFCMKSLHNRWQLTICRRTVFPSTSSVRIFYNKIIVSPMNHLLLFVWWCLCKSACCISLNRIELLLTKSTPIVLIYVSVKHSSWKINCTWIILLMLLHTTAA